MSLWASADCEWEKTTTKLGRFDFLCNFFPLCEVGGGGGGGVQGHSREFYRTFFLCAIKQIQNNLQRVECFLLCQHVKETGAGKRRGVDGMMGKEIGSENERRRGR